MERYRREERMLKKDITYTDINEQPVTETFYFGITKAEIVEMEFATPGGLKNHIEALIEAVDGKTIITLIKDFIAMTVGQRVDGRFVKSESFAKAFMSSEPYSVVFMEFLQNPNSVSEFIKAVLPADLSEKYVEELTNGALPVGREYTEQELLDMDQDEFDAVVGTDLRKMTPAQMQIAYVRRTSAPATSRPKTGGKAKQRKIQPV